MAAKALLINKPLLLLLLLLLFVIVTKSVGLDSGVDHYKKQLAIRVAPYQLNNILINTGTVDDQCCT